MRNFWGKIKKRKLISVIIVLVILFAGYKTYAYFTNTSGQTRYVIAAVQKGAIISTVSGSGSVSAQKQVSLTAKTSGEAVYVGAKSGDYVYAGQLLAQVDTRDAEMALASAKLSLAKAKDLAETQNGAAGLAKNSSDSLTALNNYFDEVSSIIDGLDSILNNYTVSTYKMRYGETTLRDYYQVASDSYDRAKSSYNTVLGKYRALGNKPTDQEVANQISQVLASAQLLFKAVKDTNAFVLFAYNNLESSQRSNDLITDKNNLSTWTKTVDTNIASLSTNRNTITSSNYDLEALDLTVKQKEYALADCFVRAPFSGFVQIDVNKGDTISGSIGTIVTSQKIATVSLSEVDITKVRVGQKATLTFDAVDGLAITGEVVETDVVGTVSQGVVSYNVKIAFDTEDPRIKSGMSVTADIATEAKQDILVIPSSALKTSGSNSYVETFDLKGAVTDSQGLTSTQIPQQIIVTTGVSDDTNTEILSGLKEGDKIITQTLTSSVAAKSATSITSLLRPGAQQRGGR